jgi:hypothetical protein
MRYGGRAVAEAAIVANEWFPFEETWFGRLKGTVPDTVSLTTQTVSTTHEDMQPCEVRRRVVYSTSNPGAGEMLCVDVNA